MTPESDQTKPVLLRLPKCLGKSLTKIAEGSFTNRCGFETSMVLQLVFVISCQACYDITNWGVATSATCLGVQQKEQQCNLFSYVSVWIYSLVKI